MNQLREACRALAERARSRVRRTRPRRWTNSPAAPGAAAIVFVFSDLLDDVPDILAGLQHLRYQKHEVVVFHIARRGRTRLPVPPHDAVQGAGRAAGNPDRPARASATVT